MVKYVSETKAAKAISAHVILHGARVVAVVKIHHGTGRKFCNIHQRSEAWRKSAAMYGIDVSTRVGEETGHDRFSFQYASASGYGMDLTNQMLAGLWIDGHKLSDNCGEWLQRPDAGHWPRDAVAPPGYRFANYGADGPTDCYRTPGLDYLRDFGYEIVTAI